MNNSCSSVLFHFILYFLICPHLLRIQKCNTRLRAKRLCTYEAFYMFERKVFQFIIVPAIIWLATSTFVGIKKCSTCVFGVCICIVYCLFAVQRSTADLLNGRTLCCNSKISWKWWFCVDSVNRITLKITGLKNAFTLHLHGTCIPIRKWRSFCIP